MLPEDKNGVEDAEIPSLLDDEPEDRDERQDKQEREPPKDVRGAIRAAMDEVNDDDKGEKESKTDKPDKKEVRGERNKEQRLFDKDNEREVSEKEPIDADNKDKKEKKEAKEEVKIDPPPFFKVKGKSTWDKLSPEDKQVIISREKEVSDGFAQVSQRIRGVEELERVIAPRLQQIQEYGARPAQVVDRLFQWMEGISNPATKANTFKELARSFGVDLNQLTSTQQPNTTQTEEIDEPPPWFSDFTQGVTQEIGTLKQTLSSQQRTAAENVVSSWAKDKPHYNEVAPLMGQLLQSGIVGLKADGSVDLDTAYDRAIKLHPEVSALIQQEAAEKASKEASDKAAKDAKERVEKLARSRRAGAGLKPAAPSMSSDQSLRLNGSKGKSSSVRDSIKAALEEVRE